MIHQLPFQFLIAALAFQQYSNEHLNKSGYFLYYFFPPSEIPVECRTAVFVTSAGGAAE